MSTHPRWVRICDASALKARIVSRPISPILSRTAISLGQRLAPRLFAAYPGLREQPQRPSLGLAPGRGYPFHSGQHSSKVYLAGLGLCGPIPRLTADGCYPLPLLCGVGTFLTLSTRSACTPRGCLVYSAFVSIARACRGTQPPGVPELVDIDLILLRDRISCHSERSEESRKLPILDSSSLRSSE